MGWQKVHSGPAAGSGPAPVATNQQTLLNTMEDGAKPFANYAVRDLTGHKKRQAPDLMILASGFGQ
eukprot:1147787-Pelagomonas_calceolata.AAC.3